MSFASNHEMAVLLVGEAVPGCPGLDPIGAMLCSIGVYSRVRPHELCLLEAAADLLPFAHAGERFLPRRAAAAVAQFSERIERRFGSTPTTTQALCRFHQAVTEGTVHIPVYGRIPLVPPSPVSRWMSALRQMMVDLIGAVGLIQQHGEPCEISRNNALYLSLASELLPGSKHIAVASDPAEAAEALTMSRTNGMLFDEAVHFIDAYARRVLAQSACVPKGQCLLVRWEDLQCWPLEIGSLIAAYLGLPASASALLQEKVASMAVSLCASVPAERMRLTTTRLDDLRVRLGYSEGRLAGTHERRLYR